MAHVLYNRTVNGPMSQPILLGGGKRDAVSQLLRSQIISVDYRHFPPFFFPFFSSVLFRMVLGKACRMVGSAQSCLVTAEWLELELMKILDSILILLVHSVLAAANSCFWVFCFVLLLFVCFSPLCQRSPLSSWWQKLILPYVFKVLMASVPLKILTIKTFFVVVKHLLNSEPWFPHWQNVRIQLLAYWLDINTNE